MRSANGRGAKRFTWKPGTKKRAKPVEAVVGRSGPGRQPAASSEWSAARFKKEALEILEEWAQAQPKPKPKAKSKASSSKPNEAEPYPKDADDRMIRRTYRLVCQLLEAGGQAVLPTLLQESGRRYKGPHPIEDKPFKQALLLMSWWYEEEKEVALMSAKRRMALSNAMEYAYRHKVLSKNLIGFMRQVGIGKIAAKLATNHVEPGFKVRSVE